MDAARGRRAGGRPGNLVAGNIYPRRSPWNRFGPHGDHDPSPRMTTTASTHRIVVIGGGFGGMTMVKALRGLRASVTLIDRHNYHLFQPLTYQVATGALSPGEIAMPLRHVFRRRKQVEVLLGEVTGFELESREVIVRADVP